MAIKASQKILNVFKETFNSEIVDPVITFELEYNRFGGTYTIEALGVDNTITDTFSEDEAVKFHKNLKKLGFVQLPDRCTDVKVIMGSGYAPKIICSFLVIDEENN